MVVVARGNEIVTDDPNRHKREDFAAMQGALMVQ
jgi:hypothetical protein